MSDQIVLIEIGAYNLATSTIETLRYCDGLAYRPRPSETPANTLYRPFILDPGWTRQDIFTKPGNFGHTTPGEVVLDDSSGTLGTSLIGNGLTTGYAFDGRSIVIRIGARGSAYPSGYTVILNGTIDGQPKYDWGKITIHPADLTVALKKPLQTIKYAGNNVLPDGLEGVADLAGKSKLLVVSLASNMSPLLCNTAKLIYHVSIPFGSSAVAISAVRDKGVPLTVSTAYTTINNLMDNTIAPGAGHYKILSNTTDGCYIRLGSSPVGQITCDAGYNTTGVTHAQAWKALLLAYGISSGSISAADVTALDTALPGIIECGYFSDTDYFSALTQIATSAGASWYGDETGVHRLVQWSVPSGSAVMTLNELRIDTIDVSDPVGTGDLAPAYQVTGQYGQNWTPQQDANLGGDKTSGSDTVTASGGLTMLAARNWLATPYHPVVSPRPIASDIVVFGPYSAGSVTVSVPADIANGDFMIAIVVMASVVPPAGWSLLTSYTPSSGTLTSVYTRTASSEPATYTWTGSAATTGPLAYIVKYSGVVASGIDVTGSWASVVLDTNMIAPSITTTQNNTVIVGISVSATLTSMDVLPTGMVLRAQSNNLAGALWVTEQPFPTAGATGTKTFHIVNGVNGGATMLIAIAPVARPIQTQYLNAIEIKNTSMLTLRAPAQTFMDAQLAMFGVARRMITVSAWLSNAQIALLRPGAVLTLTEARWGMSAGRLMRVAGIKIDRGTGKTELSLWG